MKIRFLKKRKSLQILVVLIVLSSISLFAYVNLARGATRTWDGGCGGDTSWSCDANWSLDTEPVAGDTVVFDNTSDNDSTIDSGFGGSITIVSIDAGYDGTITMERSLTVSSTFSQASGNFTAANQSLTISSTFNLSAGNFTASSGTTIYGSTFTISGSGNFIHNSGVVSFDGILGNITCNSEPFNTVNITRNTTTVSSTCDLPIGSNPTIGNNSSCGCGTITLQGTLSGSGTITMTQYTNLTLSGSSSLLSGFSGLDQGSQNGDLTVTSSATFNAGSYSPFNIDRFTLSSSGNFTAPSGTMNVNGNFTINSGTTFSANSGTINFGSGSHSCDNRSFSNVTLTMVGASSMTIGSDCSFPLGNNPTIGNASCFCGYLTVQGTLAGTGTLATTSNTSISLDGASAALSGFSGIQVNGTGVTGNFRVTNSANFNASTYSTFSVEEFILSSSGVFTAPSSMTVREGDLTINSGTTFNSSNGILILGDGSANGTVACNNTIFGTVVVSGNLTVGSDCNLPLGANPTVGNTSCNCGVVALQGVLSGSGTIILTNNTGLTLSGASSNLTGFTGISGTSAQNILTITSSANVNLSTFSGINIYQLVLSSSGSLTAPTGDMQITNNFTNSSGAFVANGGTVSLYGTSTQVISGSNTFYNLDLTSSTARQVTFTAGTTTTVENAFTAKGRNSGSRLTMRSSSGGTQWGLTVNGAEDVSYTDIRDSNACGGHVLVAINSINSNNNDCWSFVTSGAQNPTYIRSGTTLGPGVIITGN